MKKLHILTDAGLERLIEERTGQLRREWNSELQKRVMEQDASLASLQSQINPHFLYNALEGIRGQAILDGSPVIARISQALAQYFRYSISSKNDIATLEEELGNIQNYLAIQQFRFGNRFTVDIRYDEEDGEVLGALLPKMTLQPILENAVSHGFEKNRKKAEIVVSILLTERHVNILVSDNGAGMDASTLEDLQERIRGGKVQAKSQGKHNGIAMPNVHRRLQLMFGEEYGLHVSSIEGYGTDVEIHIPFITDRTQVM